MQHSQSFPNASHDLEIKQPLFHSKSQPNSLINFQENNPVEALIYEYSENNHNQGMILLFTDLNLIRMGSKWFR